jgi:hypothetical protein
VVEPEFGKQVEQGSILDTSLVPTQDIIYDVVLSSVKVIASVAFRVRKGVCNGKQIELIR